MAQRLLHPPANSGISLVEIVVVVAIFGIMAIFAAPSLNTFCQRQRIHAALRNISTLLINARFAALKSNSYAVVEIQLDSCRAFLDNGVGAHAQDWIQQDEEPTLDTFSVGTGISLTSNCNKITHPDKFRYTSRVRVSPCSITVAFAGKANSKVVINSVGKTRIETPK